MRQYRVVFTPRAERQLGELYAYIANASSERRAENYVGRLVEECQSLAVFPERGGQRDDIRPNLRVYGYARSATIAFAVDTENGIVAIHGVFYGGQDFERALRQADDAD